MAPTETTRRTADPAPGTGTRHPQPPQTKKPKSRARSRGARSVADKPHSPIHTRSRLAENYEQPISGREDWWRSTIKETPNPGSYSMGDFVSDLKTRPSTYNFKSEGRKRDVHPVGCGATLLPGAYGHQDFLYRLDKFNTKYSFKDTGRDARDYMNFGRKDKDINLCPTSYKTEEYMKMSVDRQPSKHWNFRSQTKRFPTVHFVPKEGPAPGNYDYAPPASAHAVSSSFKSKTPRFSTSHTKVPGPGTYERTFQYPMVSTLAKMGRQNGVFFASAFQV